MLIKDRAYYGLPKELRYLALCGVPINYLYKQIQIHQFNFAPTSVCLNKFAETTVIPADYQYNFLIEVFKNLQYFGEPSTYAVGSFPTDQASYQLATLITVTYYEFIRKEKIFPKIKWLDLGNPDYEFLRSDEAVSLMVIHGLSENSSDPKKLEMAKDFLRRGVNATRILLATTQNILTYTIMSLEVEPDAVFQLMKTTNRIVI